MMCKSWSLETIRKTLHWERIRYLLSYVSLQAHLVLLDASKSVSTIGSFSKTWRCDVFLVKSKKCERFYINITSVRFKRLLEIMLKNQTNTELVIVKQCYQNKQIFVPLFAIWCRWRRSKQIRNSPQGPQRTWPEQKFRDKIQVNKLYVLIV